MDFEKLIYLGVGAIIGFLLSLAKDWLLEGKKQKEKDKQFEREKLEELYELLLEENSYVSEVLGIIALMYDKNCTKNSILDRMNVIGEKKNILNTTNRINILINLYLTKFTSTRKEMYDIRFNIGMIVQQTGKKDSDVLQKKCYENLEKWNEIEEKIQSEIKVYSTLI